MTPAQLEELKKLCAAATPGPWRSESYGGETGCVSEIYTIATGDDGDRENAMTKETASFIAAARTAVPELIAEVERLRGLIKQTEFVDGNLGAYCPHCIGVNSSAYSVSGHRDDCPAFTPDGEVK